MGDVVTVVREALCKFGQARIAQPFVEGAMGRKVNTVTLAWGQAIAQGAGVTGKLLCLEVRGSGFGDQQGGQGDAKKASRMASVMYR